MTKEKKSLFVIPGVFQEPETVGTGCDVQGEEPGMQEPETVGTVGDIQGEEPEIQEPETMENDGEDRSPAEPATDETNAAPMKAYIGKGIVLAVPMDKTSFYLLQGKKLDAMAEKKGYSVLYPDESWEWMSKGVFEGTYREVTEEEKALLA